MAATPKQAFTNHVVPPAVPHGLEGRDEIALQYSYFQYGSELQ